MLMLESIILSAVTQQLLFHQRYVVVQGKTAEFSFYWGNKWYWKVTESQKKLGQKVPWRSPGPTSCSDQGQLQNLIGFLGALPCQGLKISKDRDSRASLGNPFQHLTTPAVNGFFFRSTQNTSCCNLWLSLCNSDNTQLHLLLSPHIGSKSGITTPLILLQVETNLSLSLCIKHSHPLTALMALHPTRSSMSTPPLYKGAQMWLVRAKTLPLACRLPFLPIQPITQPPCSPHYALSTAH